MKSAPIKGNALLDVILKGLKLTGDFNPGKLGLLSLVSKHYHGRLQQDFIWESFLEEDDNKHIGLGYKEMAEINQLVRDIGCEYPAHQPSTDSQWEALAAVPKDIKQCILELHAKVPNIVSHARAIWHSMNDNDRARDAVRYWLLALRDLYRSANDEADLFHGLFLNNHDFAQRALKLALAPHSNVSYSTTVLRALTECRFSSLTMSSEQLNLFFADLTTYIQERQRKERHYNHSFDGWFDAHITEDDIKGFIKEKYYAKSLLWRSAKEPIVSPSGSQSLPATQSLSGGDDSSQPSRKRKAKA